MSLPVPTDLYCTLEVDSFGYFVSKAKTRVFRDTTEPEWDEVSGPHRDPGLIPHHAHGPILYICMSVTALHISPSVLLV